MKCIVTGAAGFIGSHLCEELLNGGHMVTGLDAFIPYYPQVVKHRNLLDLLRHPNLRFYRVDLRSDSIDDLLSGAEVIFHLAAMPGLMQSWTDLDGYWTCNVLATQKLLESVRRCGIELVRFVHASTSSVYGRTASGDETLPTQPISPYGITKLAAEHMCRAYAETHQIPIVTLRYFSVYGPRQRPDMGYHRFIQAMLDNKSVTVYGDGQQVRGNTYVADCVQATIDAIGAPAGEVYNIGGGETASVWDILHKLEEISGRKVRVRQKAARPGDQLHTCADTTKIRQQLGWMPRTPLDEGLARQWEWQAKQNYSPVSHGGVCETTAG
ncbi:MAG TPA: NAD-dependent epimerase/dehydratase family protein [Gemmataceae bacterium]|nr:NAD-dependent epimerase/dehydratase family protein [Gemmataceae bacterium]